MNDLLVQNLLKIISEYCVVDLTKDQLNSFEELDEQLITNFEESLKKLAQEMVITDVMLEQLLKLFSYRSGFFGNPFEHFTTILLYLKQLGLQDYDLQRVTDAILTKEPKIHFLVRLSQYPFVINRDNLEAIFSYNKNNAVFLAFGAFPLTSPLATNDNLALLFSLPTHVVSRLPQFISNLVKADQLTQDNFVTVIKVMSQKLPTVTSSTYEKENSTKPAKRILDGRISFYCKKETESVSLAGGFGHIHKGFDEQGALIYALKYLDKSDKKMAKREVKYHRLLGREAFYFSKPIKKREDECDCILSTWQVGKPLGDFATSELQSFSMQDRLQWVYGTFVQLERFHSDFRIHGDIKGSNLIVDADKKMMNLIDFGSAHRVGSKKKFGMSLYNSDPYSHGEFYGDLYNMGTVIGQLFPELFSSTEMDFNIETKPLNKKFTAFEFGILSLVAALQHQEPTKSCTCNDALLFCQGLLERDHHLVESEIKKMMYQTITRKEISLDDALHGVWRRGM